MIADLVLNSTLLVTLTVLYSFLARNKQSGILVFKIISGFLFGAIAVAGMNLPVYYQPGIIYDGRSIVLSLAGLFGGGIVAGISALLAVAYRLYMGGAGVWAGLTTIVTAASVGLFFRKIYAGKPENIEAIHLFGMGLLTNLVMLLCQLLLPWPFAVKVISQVWVPVLLVFPFTTLLMGLLLKNETRRILAEAEIRESATRYRTTLHSIGDAVITTDNQGIITFINPMAEQLTGWAELEALGQPIASVFPVVNESTGVKADCLVEKVLDTGVVIGLANHTLLINRQEKRIPIADSGAPIRDEEGNIIGVVLVFRDQTDERNMHRQLQDRERLYHSLTDQSPVGIFRTRADGYTTYVNPKWCSISGVSPEQALGTGWLAAVHPDDRDQLSRGWDQATGNGLKSVAEYRFRKSNGSPTWVVGEAVPESSAEGDILGYIGTITDITERKLAEQSLLRSRENFRRLMDEFPMGLRIVSQTGQTLYVNQSFLSLYGFENLPEYLSASLEKRYTRASMEQHLIRKEKRKNGEEVEPEYEVEILHKDGGVRNLHVYRKLIDWDGSPQFLVIYQDFTERYKAEEALVRSEKSLKEAQEIAGMGHWDYDLIQEETSWSENCYRLFGLQPFEIKPDYAFFRSLIHPDDLLQLELGEKLIMEKQEIVDLRFRVILPDGQQKWIMNRVIPEFKLGRLVKLRGINMDITESKQAMDALKRSEKGYKNLFENDSAIKLLIDMNTGDLVDANQSARAFYGYSRQQLKQMNLRQIVLASDEELDLLLAVARKSKNKQSEQRHRLADGSIRDVEVFTSRIEFKGKFYLHSIIHDITEKRVAENRLQLLGKSTEQSPVSIVITDPKGYIEYVNPKFTQISGYSYDEAVGKTPAILKSEQHPLGFYEDMWNTILAGQEWHGELLNRKKNGELYWESALISSILDEKGEIIYFVAAKEDITEKKRIIADLQMAKEKAEESDRLKSAFLANMSHEIRTPLNAILGFTNILVEEEKLDQGTKEEFYAILDQSSENLLQIINDILDISKLETGQLVMHRDQFDVRPVLNGLYTMFKQRLHETDQKEIELKLVMPEEPVVIHNDKVRFNQIFMNLLSNAVKFTPHGQICFGITGISSEQISFFVSDTGIGISPEYKTAIFDRFRQADDSTTRAYGGAGLGLSIVKKLVELMNGDIQLESEPGRGTTFTFRIPV
ncbi:PAS domain S-box protein [Gaoshiqia sp. Z1-71]|uniref:PAS domain S-box protein n=1 Tax=Gaoshiqia hydrogeniformans TaxID=3290090 RepID=UPI003BF7ECBE